MNTQFWKAYLQNNNSYKEVYRALEKEGRSDADFYVLIALSSIIASFGLLLNSTAAIIGAMLLAPLMSPILSLSFSSLIRKSRFTLSSLFSLVSGILFAFTISWVIGCLFTGIEQTPEIIARTQPNLMDLFIALASGFLGGYAKVRKTLSGLVFGVAISISLIPPLCVVGIALAHGWYSECIGALLLFTTNMASILLSSLMAFMLGGYLHLRDSAKAMILPGLAVLLLAVPLAYSLWAVMDKNKLELGIRTLLETKTYTFADADIIKVRIKPYTNPLRVTITIRARRDTISDKQAKLVALYLARYMEKPIDLTINITPIEQIVISSDDSLSEN